MNPLKRPAMEEENETLLSAKLQRMEDRPQPSAEDVRDTVSEESDDGYDSGELEASALEIEGLYLDTVNRASLDFDFEQL
ncbi:hypothetical protein GGH91_005577, partial [Coemansia sp. RSA 2671]